MKAVSKLVVLLSLGAFAPSIASAMSAEQAYLESCLKHPSVPVPIAVVTPTIAPGFGGTTVQLEFVVDATGKPVDLAVKSSPDDRVAAVVMEAVKQWRFQPAEINGVPVEKRVLLPVKIVDDDPLASTRYAAH